MAHHDQLKEDKESSSWTRIVRNSTKRVSSKFKDIIKDMEDIHSETEKQDFFFEEGEDVFSRFGAGIITYFHLIKISIFLFALAVFTTLPLMIQYSSF